MAKAKRVLGIIVILALLIGSSAPFLVSMTPVAAQTENPYLVRTFVDEDGNEIAVIIVPGKPPEIKAKVVDVPEPNIQMGINTLTGVPAFDWSYGCSATSAAMLFGYYDRTGYSNMYTGPTNGGVCPLDNSTWGPGIGGSDGECPLSATHQGKDGRTIRGHVDDYWIYYDDAGPDPWIVNGWTEHTHGDCTGDFMGTNQSAFGSIDGSTTFYYWTDGSPFDEFELVGPSERDGCHGMKLFAESRGYSVAASFNQYIYGYEGNTLGFTFDQYTDEIDAGRPVLIQIEGHTMLGYGYDTTGNIIYIHDTWDHSNHQMTWSGTYSDAQHYGVTVIQLASTPLPDLIVESLTHSPVNPTTADTITFTAVVKNVGSAAAGASTLEFRVGGEFPYPTYPVPALAPGASHTVQRQEVLSAQSYLNTATADINDEVTESNETNNQKTDSYTVTQVSQPAVTTNDATNITTNSATLNGNLDNLGTASTVYGSFEYGLTTAYGYETTPQEMTSTGPFSFPLTGLLPNTTYHVRAKAVGDGTSYGLDKSFTTSDVGAVVVSIEPSNQTVPAGGSFNVDVEVDSEGIPITACNVTVTFDANLTATGLTGADLLGTFGVDAIYMLTIDVGEVSYEGVRIDGPVAVDGDFVTIDFDVAGDATGTYPLVVDATLMDANGDPIAVIENDDGDIDLADFVEFAAAYSSSTGDANYDVAGDFDDDGNIGLADFVEFAAVYGT